MLLILIDHTATMFEAIGNIFEYETTDQLLAIIFLLAITFFVGIFIYAIVIHLPKSRRAKKDIHSLDVRNKSLQKDNKNLTDKLAVQDQKLVRLEEQNKNQDKTINNNNNTIATLQNANLTLDKNLKNQQRETQNSNNELNELKRLYKYAQADIKTYELKAKEALKAQTHAQKENQETWVKNEALKKEIRQLQRNLRSIEDQHQQLESRHKELLATQEEFKAELKRVRERLTNSERINEELESERRELIKNKDQLEQLTKDYEEDILSVQKQLTTTKHKKADIAKQLSVYTEKEAAIEKAQKQENSMFSITLQDAAQAMEQAMLYTESSNISYNFVEQPELLEQRMQQEQKEAEAAKYIPQTPALRSINIEEEEYEELDRVLRQAGTAIKLNGFYGPIDKNLLISKNTEPISDDILLEQLLEESAQIIDQTEGYFKTFESNNWIENDVIWKNKINDAIIQPNKESATVSINEEEQLVMTKMLDAAHKALQNEGIYTDIHPTRLIEVTHITEPIDLTKDPKYKTEIERSVVAEIGKSIPMMNDIAKDDLKKISGVNEFIEQKLNHLGIYTYEQICYFTPEFIQKLTAAIGFAEKTIQQNQWMTKARDLYKLKNNIN